MKRSTEQLMGIAIMLGYMAILQWLFCMTVLENECNYMAMQFIIPTMFLLLSYYVNYFATERGISLSVYVVMQLVLAGIGTTILMGVTVLEPASLGTRIFLGVLYSGGVFVSAFTAAEKPTQRAVILYFDGVMTLLLLLLFLDHYLHLPLTRQTLLSGILAETVSLVALISARVGQEYSARTVSGNPWLGRGLIVVGFLLVAGVTALLAACASGGVQSLSETLLAAIRGCLHALVAALKAIWHVIETFFLWLSQFFKPEQIEDSFAVDDFSVIAVDTQQLEEVPLPWWLKYAGLGAAIVVIVLVLYRMRGERITDRRMIQRRSSAYRGKRENGLRSALRELLEKIHSAVRFRVDCLRCRKTAAGLLVWCERHTDKEHRRRSGESGEAFLRRISEMAESGAQAEALQKLALLVEQSFYSVSPVTVPRELFHEVRQCKFT